MEAKLDCGDNSCEFAEVKTGMRTNGGCRCIKDLSFDRRMAVRGYIKALREENVRLTRERDEQSAAAMALRCLEDRLSTELAEAIRERDEARDQVGRMADAHIANARLEAEVARLEGLILDWAEGDILPSEMVREANRISDQRSNP